MKLLLVSALLLVLSTLPADGSPVYDVSGNIVKPGTPYYIIPALLGADGGGFFPLSRPRICPRCLWCCPLNVAQTPSNFDKGISVFLSPSNSSEGDVHLLTDLTIEFTSPPPDRGSAMWKLDSADSNGKRYVTLNGSPFNTIDVKNWFKIVKANRYGYELLYCPSEDSACGSLGIEVEDGNRWLVLSDNPFRFVFLKA